MPSVISYRICTTALKYSIRTNTSDINGWVQKGSPPLGFRPFLRLVPGEAGFALGFVECSREE